MSRTFMDVSRAVLCFTLLAGLSWAKLSCTTDQGQIYLDAGQYDAAIREFACVIERDPTGVDGYRGRIEAALLQAHYSDAVRDYARVTAYVLPVHPDASTTILAGYSARLAANPGNIGALTGASFANWWFFSYAQAIHLLKELLDREPDNAYGNLFRGSSRLLSGAKATEGIADLERAIQLDPLNPHVRFIVADAYTYGIPYASRALAEASQALIWGLDTPRIHAILGAAYNTFLNLPAAAQQIQISINQVTTQLVATASLAAGVSMKLPLVPGRTFETPVTVTSGQLLSVSTSSRDFYDTILVLLAPDGTPVVGADDSVKYFAALNWTAGLNGTYRLRVTSFESVNTGELVVMRK